MKRLFAPPKDLFGPVSKMLMYSLWDQVHPEITTLNSKPYRAWVGLARRVGVIIKSMP